MASNNTVQYTITAKDQASAVFAQVATKAKGVGANIAESFAVVGAAAVAMRGVVSDLALNPLRRLRRTIGLDIPGNASL